jgi:hypothetical protein
MMGLGPNSKAIVWAAIARGWSADDALALGKEVADRWSYVKDTAEVDHEVAEWLAERFTKDTTR